MLAPSHWANLRNITHSNTIGSAKNSYLAKSRSQKLQQKTNSAIFSLKGSALSFSHACERNLWAGEHHSPCVLSRGSVEVGRPDRSSWPPFALDLSFHLTSLASSFDIFYIRYLLAFHAIEDLFFRAQKLACLHHFIFIRSHKIRSSIFRSSVVSTGYDAPSRIQLTPKTFSFLSPKRHHHP